MKNMQGYDAKIFVVGGATIILNMDGWRMYLLLGEKTYIYDGWADEKPVDEKLPFARRTFPDFLKTAQAEKIVERMGVTMTLYQSEQEIRQSLTRIVAEFQKQLAVAHEKRESA